MKMKKLKKLTLTKEVISNLDGNEMNQLKGGDLSLYAIVMGGGPNPFCDYGGGGAPAPNGGGGGGGGAATPLPTQAGGGQFGCQNYTIGCPSAICTTLAWQNC